MHHPKKHALERHNSVSQDIVKRFQVNTPTELCCFIPPTYLPIFRHSTDIELLVALIDFAEIISGTNSFSGRDTEAICTAHILCDTVRTSEEI
jgi:hypothetical protein